MVRQASEKDIERLANFLKFKKERGERVGLFLGHRAGVLYNNKLYEALKKHITIADDLRKMLRRDSLVARELSKMIRDLHSYDGLSGPDRFRKCYKFLGKYFSENSIHNIFSEVLAPTQNREEDKLMAELINAEFFDTIFTTNFETSLEDNCDSIGMSQNEDYELLIYKAEGNITLKKEGCRCGKIIKVFGEFAARKYNTVGKEFNLEKNQYFKNILLSELVKDIVVLGYDPTWDGPIEQAFQVRDEMTNGTLWFVNDKRPPPNTHFARILRQPSSTCIVGTVGNYKSFLEALSGFIEGRANWKPESKISLPTVQTYDLVTPDAVRKSVFISYSHADKKYLNRFQTHLKFLKYKTNIKVICDAEWEDIWDDTKIPIGANWLEEIEGALSQAKVAILLVSADFFASDFINEKELPVLIKAKQAEQIELRIVMIGACGAFKYSYLSNYQTFYPPTETIENMTEGEQNLLWAKLTEKVITDLSS